MRDQAALRWRSFIPVALVLIVGLLVRLWAMRWPPLPTDMNAWLAWGERMLQVGPANFYSDDVFADYAPGYLYVLWLTAAIKNGLFADAGLGTYHFLIRITPVLFDLATAALIFWIVRDWIRRESSAFLEQTTDARNWLPTLAAACWSFNPAIIFNSATWSQVDSTFTFLMLLALVLLLRERAEWAVVTYVLAFLIKPQAISLAPVIAIVLLVRYPVERWLTAGLVGLSLMFSLIVPFFGLRSFIGLIMQLQGSVETYPYTSLFTYNLWGLYGFWRDDTVPFVAGLTLRSVGTLLYIIGLIYGSVLLVRYLRRAPLNTPALFFFALYFAFLPVMVLTRMHERYLFPVLPLLLVIAFTAGTWLRALRCTTVAVVPLLGYLLLTALFTINLLHVYIFYINYDSGGVPASNRFFYFVDGNSKLWSALVLAMFVVVTVALPFWTTRATMRSDRIDAALADQTVART